MPGIVGIIASGPLEGNASKLDVMTNAMIHEPFYTSGTYINKQLNLYVGWVSHAGSFTDCMPIWNETKDICLIFSGEDFTETAAIEDLRTKGHELDSRNAGYLVHLYEEHGIGFFEKLNGWFSGLIMDLREGKFILFNDRYGLQRIYYHEHTDGFYFSSEAKSILKALPELRQLNMSSLAETFSFGCVLQDKTLFSKISLLPAASMWTFTGNRKIEKRRYFSPEVWEKQPILSGGEYGEKLKETFARILPKYRRDPNKTGMSLTGGMDGRMIMAWAKPVPGELPCYTFGSLYGDCTDVVIARRVAKACKQPHQTIEVGSGFFSQFPRLAEKAVYISDGAMDVTGSVELYCNSVARQIAPIRLTGNYGSEILRGNVAFKAGFRNENLLNPDFAKLVQTAALNYHAERECHWLSFIGFKQVPWHHYSRLAVEQSQLTLRSPYLDNELVALMYQAPQELILSKDPSLRVIEEGLPALAKIPTDRGVLYRPTPVIGGIQRLYWEFTAKAEYAYDYGMPQWLANIDHILSPLKLEKLFLGRHKFYHFRVWYRDQFPQYLRDVLLDPRTLKRSLFQPHELEGMVNSHIKGNRNYTSEIHRALTVELLQRQLID